MAADSAVSSLLLLSEVSMERRVAPMFRMNQGETKSPALLVYDGPVFDGQSTVAVQIKRSETDFYPAAGVNENLLSKNELLGTFDQEVRFRGRSPKQVRVDP